MRTFIAIELESSIKAELVRLQQKLARFDGVVRWIQPEAMHLTLRFLGDVADHRIPEICRKLDEVASGLPPFDVPIRGTGCFPRGGRPRVVWADIEDSDGALAACHGTIEAGLDAIGFEPEGRRFNPHLTLGRVKQFGDALGLRESVEALGEFDADCQPVDDIVLFASELKRGGAIHTPMHRAVLGG